MITSKAQTTIPQPVRFAPGLHEGDEVAEDPFAALSEWNSAADREGYADF
jgi:antitoxin PrlF